MPLRIPVPESSFEEIEVTLSGDSYLFTYRYNERSLRWKLDVGTSDGERLVSGMTLIEQVSPTAHYRTSQIADGHLSVIRMNDTKSAAGRYNLGVGKDYELIYITNEELGSIL